MIRIPSFLTPGDGIGFPAPSFGCTIEPYRTAFSSALSFFTSQGFRVFPGENVNKDDGTGISSSPYSCGHELTTMYCSPDTKALLSCGGGELMCEILPHLSFDAIKEAPPKWFAGYSDNTNFSFLLTTLCDTASLYCACAPSFGQKPLHPALLDALLLLTGQKKVFSGYPFWEKDSLKTPDTPLASYNTTEKTSYLVYLPGHEAPVSSASLDEPVSLSGTLLGGCLDILSVLCGTRFDQVKPFLVRQGAPDFPVLWFLEACDLSVFSLRRSLFQLKEAGWFSTASGFLFGRPMHFNEPMFGLDQYRAVYEVLQDLGVPILFDVDLGHLPPTLPFVCGARAEVTVAEKLQLSYPEL